MNWTVDQPRRIGDLAIAAIVELDVSVQSRNHAVTGVAEKRPLLYLRLQEGDVAAIDVNGHSYEAEEIEFLYPTAIARAYALLDRTE